MGLDHRRQEQWQGCRVSQGIKWRRCELPFIKSFHGLQGAGRYTMACGDGGREAARAIKKRVKENCLKRVTERRIKKWAQGQVNKKGSCGDAG